MNTTPTPDAGEDGELIAKLDGAIAVLKEARNSVTEGGIKRGVSIAIDSLASIRSGFSPKSEHRKSP